MSIEAFAKQQGFVPQRLRWWRKKLEAPAAGVKREAELALLPLQVTPPKRGEPVAVYLRGGQVIRVGRGFDDEAFARVVAILEAG